MTRLEEAVIKAAREMSRDARVELYERLMIDLNDVEQTAVDQAWRTQIQQRLDRMQDREGSSKLSEDVVARRRAKRSD